VWNAARFKKTIAKKNHNNGGENRGLRTGGVTCSAAEDPKRNGAFGVRKEMRRILDFWVERIPMPVFDT